eukprot:TRINITY_DN49326_c1_g1_i1.p1 TRINITY_DN49326_c1_g1~~TRINITY_DN49326_c1_g1_i1.p1  ORF type:complete len:480 (+),score=36.34 TRINITY_DN49326_c1_g1_i1:56-1441(+)
MHAATFLAGLAFGAGFIHLSNSIYSSDLSFLATNTDDPQRTSSDGHRVEGMPVEAGSDAPPSVTNAAASVHRAQPDVALHGMCIVGEVSLRLSPSWTSPFARAALAVAEKLALESFRRQNTSAQQWQMSWVVLTLSGLSEFQHPDFRNQVNQLKLKLYSQTQVFVSEGERAALSRISSGIKMRRCAWVAHVRLDADDVLSTNFFTYLTAVVLPRLTEGMTDRGESWLGGVVGQRNNSELEFASHRCRLIVGRSFSSPAGCSIGQTIIVRRDVYDSLHVKKDRSMYWRGGHAENLKTTREIVVRSFLKRPDYNSSCATGGKADCPLEDATESRIFMLRPEKDGFGHIGIYTRTPMSGTFDWYGGFRNPKCNESAKAAVSRHFRFDASFVFEAYESGVVNLSLEDACRSNVYFLGANPTAKAVRAELRLPGQVLAGGIGSGTANKTLACRMIAERYKRWQDRI